MLVQVVCVYAQSCPTLFDPMDSRLPGSTLHAIFQARIPEWVAVFYSSTLAWKIPWTEEPDRLQSTGSQRVGHD